MIIRKGSQLADTPRANGSAIVGEQSSPALAGGLFPVADRPVLSEADDRGLGPTAKLAPMVAVDQLLTRSAAQDRPGAVPDVRNRQKCLHDQMNLD